MSANGEWKDLPTQEAAIVFNRNKLVDLANHGLPVTSQNAGLLVDYLDAFNADNENIFPITYTVPRCGWYNFGDTEFFVDPRLSSVTTEKNISVVVDSNSTFALALRLKGSFDSWRKAYKIAKKSPIARLIVAAAIAPPLLKVLGERNFLVYICAPTRAGKTTALYLGASAVGSEKMIRSFDATKNGLAGAAADVNDFAFLVDEKQVADNRLKDAFDNLVYALANGIGRTKLNKDSTLRKVLDWRTIAVMTGETQLLPDNVTGGANTRLLSLNVSSEILSASDCKQIRNIIKDNYGHVFPLVVNKIISLGKEKLRATYDKLVETFETSNPNVLPEYCRYMAVLALADSLLNSVLGTDNALAESIATFAPIFALVPTTTDISDTARERDFVLGFIAQNQNRFIGGNVDVNKMQTVYGQFTEDYVYITVAALKKACADEGFDYRKLAADLVDADFFVPSNKVEKGYKNQQLFVQKKIGQANTRCYRIRLKDTE